MTSLGANQVSFALSSVPPCAVRTVEPSRVIVCQLTRVPEQVGTDVLAAKLRRKQVLLVDDAADRDVAALEIRVRHVLEEAEGVRIVQLAVLLKLLDVIGPLQTVHHHVAAVIRAVE